MSFSQSLQQALAPFHLLKHPFYQSWNRGELRLETLQTYARSYFHHVQAFPQYISATHSLCDNLEDRRVLLENLVDEEGLHGTPHPELWLQFAEGLGVSRLSIPSHPQKNPIQKVISCFMASARASYEEGLASLYAYEYQVPEVAETKIKGLIEHYSVTRPEALSFFKVHMEADVFHREACEKLLDKLSNQSQKRALQAGRRSAQSLWDFLSDLQREAS